MTAVAAMSLPPWAFAKMRRQRLALSLSCLLHTLLLAALLWMLPAPSHVGIAVSRAPITLDLLAHAKPAATAATPSPAQQPAPRPRAHRTAHPRPLLPEAGPLPAMQQLPEKAAAADDSSLSTAPTVAAVANVAAPSVEPTSAGASSADRVEPLPIEYLREVSRMIRVNLNYPWQARRDSIEGTVVVHILLARDGSVVSVSLVQGASNSALDEEACNVVLRIRKFPGLPDEVLRGGREFAIDQPIRFHRA